MDKLKQWIALTALAAVVIAAAGWFLLISPKRTEAADLRSQTDTQVTANAALRTQISVLKAQAKALPAKQAALAAVAAKIPGDPALPSLIRALSTAADAANVELLSLAPSAPTAVAAPAAAPAPVVSAAPGAAPAAATAPAASAAAGTLEQIGLNLSVVGGYFQVEQFLDQLESLSRALKVNTLSLGPGTNPLKPASATAATTTPSGTLAASISATVYMAMGRITTATPTAPAVGK